jgi:hypothetical protein
MKEDVFAKLYEFNDGQVLATYEQSEGHEGTNFILKQRTCVDSCFFEIESCSNNAHIAINEFEKYDREKAKAFLKYTIKFFKEDNPGFDPQNN